MAKVEELSSGNYRIRVYDKRTGKRKSFTAPTKREVKVLAAQFLANVDEELVGKFTVGKALTRYVDNRSAVLSPSTEREYRSAIARNYESLEHYDVDSVTSEDIQAFVNEFARTHSPKSTRDAYGLLASAIRAVRPNKIIRVNLPQKEVTERHIPTDDDIKALIKQSGGNLKKAILLASVGTLRRGEVCSLEYSDISNNIVHVHTDMVRGVKGWVIKNVPKTTSSNRYIDFPEEVIKELGEGEGRVVTCSPQCVSNQFVALRNKLGLECRFHDLRHYAASIMHAIGVPDQYIMERGGWSSDVTLKSVYRNVLDDKRSEFANVSNLYMSNLISSIDT